jgi:chromosomal replication initiator protein
MDLEHVWATVLFSLQDRVRPEDIDIWLREARPQSVDRGCLLVEVPTRFHADWIADNYLDALRHGVRGQLGSSADVRLTYHDDPTAEATRGGDPALLAADHGGSSGAAADRSGLRPAPTTGLNPAQLFESFVVGECNRFAHAAALAVCDNPANHYNPLYVYGDTGLGKTHLMHAIGNEIRRRDATATIVYVTAEEFTNEMINSIRFKRTEEFRQRYRQLAKVLLVDDIQFLSGKERTQEEFFFTFNALQASGRQIVLTSDVPPGDIRALEPRLRTRFEGGLIADMQPPDRETMTAILQQKAEQAGLTLPPDVIEAISATVDGSIRELEGVVNRLAALDGFYRQPLTLEFCRRHLPRLFVPEPTNVTVASVIEVVARLNNLRSADITGKKRTRALTEPRHLAMYLARKHTRLSFPELGREFGGRDHSTIQHGYHKVEQDLATDPDLVHQVRLVEQSLGLRSR